MKKAESRHHTYHPLYVVNVEIGRAAAALNLELYDLHRAAHIRSEERVGEVVESPSGVGREADAAVAAGVVCAHLDRRVGARPPRHLRAGVRRVKFRVFV